MERQQHNRLAAGSSNDVGQICHDPIMQAVASVAALIRHFEHLHQNTNTYKSMVESRSRNHGIDGNEVSLWSINGIQASSANVVRAKLCGGESYTNRTGGGV